MGTITIKCSECDESDTVLVPSTQSCEIVSKCYKCQNKEDEK
jgi:hypothetical protein